MLKKGDNFFSLIICILVMLVFGFVTLLFNVVWGVTQIVCTFLLAVLCFEIVQKHHGNFANYLEQITFHVDNATKECLMYAPMPVVLFKKDGSVLWCNDEFFATYEEQELFGTSVDTLFEQPVLRKLFEEEKIVFNTSINDRHYTVFGNVVKMDKKDSELKFGVLYLFDDTETFEYVGKYKSEAPVVAEIIVDNYDDALRNTPENYHSMFAAEIDNKIYSWFSDCECIVKKVEKDKYFVIFMKKDLDEMVENKFSILEDVKEIKCGNKYSATLSIGVGYGGQSLKEKAEFARAAVTLALGRGGDQSITKEYDNTNYFGGKSREHEKTTRVKARVTAQALRDLFMHASNIIIMGHKHIDADSFGAAVGIRAIANSMDKEAYILCDINAPQINQLVKRISQNIPYEEAFIKREEVAEKADSSTVVVVVDTHRPAYTEMPELLEQKTVILIDHHRRSAEFIEDTTLSYHEPYASSTCELVAELLQYAGGNLKISQYEAEAIYAGIMLDTKDFATRTGVRTFEAAAYLKRCGIDIEQVRKFFKNDFESYIKIAKIISDAEIINSKIAISTSDEVQSSDMRIIAAQAADKLLSVNEIEASFVIMQLENEVTLSARSIGNVNVQVIMEKLGGGGHQTMAGAQFKDESLEEVREKLLTVIDEHFEETE